MFEGFENARRSRRSRWIYGVMAAALGLHGLLLVGFVVHGWWATDKLELPREGVALAVTTPAPSPPPARKGSPEPATSNADNPRKVTRPAPADTTQPVRLSEPVESQPAGGGSGVQGHPDGSTRGVARSICVGPTCPDSPVAGEVHIPTCRKDAGCCDRGDCCDNSVCEEKIVPQHAVAKQFLSGERKPRPDDATRAAMARDHAAQVVATVKYCISKRGAVSRLELLKSSGYPAYDQALTSAMRRWRYRPFLVNGQPTPVCSATTFVYRMTR